MAITKYEATHTGQQIDDAVTAVAEAQLNGGIASQNALDTKLSNNFTATATVTDTGGEPSVVITPGGTVSAPTLAFAFKNVVGPTGVGIKNQTITYAQSASGVTPPSSSSDWSNIIPEVTSGNYLWTRVAFQYTDNTASQPFYAVSPQGIEGTPGVGIDKILVTYAWNNSQTTPPTSGWSAAIPSRDSTDTVLWTKMDIYLSNNPQAIYQSITIPASTGPRGPQGVKGMGIESSSTSYTMSESGTVIPTSGWVNDITTIEAKPGWYLWSRTRFTYEDDTYSSYIYTKAIQGTEGTEGAVGTQGPQGKSITAVNVQYSGNNTDWHDPPFDTSSYGTYYIRFKYTWLDPATDTTSTTYSSSAAVSNGISIRSSQVYYAKSNNGSTPPDLYDDDGGVDTTIWKNSIADVGTIEAAQFLWSWTRISYSRSLPSTNIFSVSQKGDVGDAPNLGFTATIDNNVGTPSVEVTGPVVGEDGVARYTFVFTNMKGATGATGNPGQNGESPTITMGTVTTGAAGTNASASLTGTYPNYVLNLTIPRGNTGPAGTAASGTYNLTTSSWTGSSAPYVATITHSYGWRPFVSIWSATSPYEEYSATVKSTASNTITITSNVKIALKVQIMSSGATS